MTAFPVPMEELSAPSSLSYRQLQAYLQSAPSEAMPALEPGAAEPLELALEAWSQTSQELLQRLQHRLQCQVRYVRYVHGLRLGHVPVVWRRAGTSDSKCAMGARTPRGAAAGAASAAGTEVGAAGIWSGQYTGQ